MVEPVVAEELEPAADSEVVRAAASQPLLIPFNKMCPAHSERLCIEPRQEKEADGEFVVVQEEPSCCCARRRSEIDHAYSSIHQI